MTEGALAPETGKQSDVAGRDTPLIRNHWYVAAMSEEVTRKPIRRTILEQDVVLYRGEDGTPIALQNRCAHRSYPLHLGELNGDRIICGYHGLEYGPDGRCAMAPSLGAGRPGIRVRSYPVKQAGPFIWIWTGDPEQVDDSKFVDQPWFTDEANWRYVYGYIDMNANYLGLHENVMDLTHFPFLHTFAKGQLGLAMVRPTIEVRPDAIRTHLLMPNFPVSPVAQEAFQFEGPVAEDSRVRGQVPGMHWAEVTWIDSATPPKSLTRYIVHCLTPASKTRTHYFWAVSRNGSLDNPALDAEFTEVAKFAFTEDQVALEEIEAVVARDNRPEFREIVIASDAAGIHVLRLFARWAAEDQAQSHGEAAE